MAKSEKWHGGQTKPPKQGTHIPEPTTGVIKPPTQRPQDKPKK